MVSLGRALALTVLLVVPGALACGQAASAGQPPLGVFIPASRPPPAPSVGFTDLDGKAVSLSDFAGKPVLINLWATWCAPCRHEMPSLARLQRRLGDKIAILAISQDLGGSKVVAPYIAGIGLKGVKVYLDPHNRVGHAFNVDGLPTSFLIDRQGRVLGRVEGEAEWDSPKMLAIINPLLPENEVIKTSFPQAHP
jgi:thiol-disulfide isomerase/thioredoxin